MPNFKVLSHFRLRKWLSKIKKRVLTPSFPQPTSSSKWVGEQDYNHSGPGQSHGESDSDLVDAQGEGGIAGGEAEPGEQITISEN